MEKFRGYPYLPQYTAAWLRSQNRHQRHPARRGENAGGGRALRLYCPGLQSAGKTVRLHYRASGLIPLLHSNAGLSDQQKFPV